MREIDTDQLAGALNSGATLVDVREPREYADGHVPGAVNIPMGRLTGRLKELDRSVPVYVVNELQVEMALGEGAVLPATARRR